MFDILQGCEPIRAIKNAHTDVISCLTMVNEEIIASGSWDKTIKIWNWERGLCVGNLEGHEKSVKCLVMLDEDRIASGSEDKSIRLWNWRDRTALKVINNAHAGHVYQIILLD